ncbi:16S rRNA (adenine(1518)-N(6)/adenine(1519)-N(6))-dimethyltransferase RsmA [Bullifex porci]|uniref:16S rRNA (adenine(1518)-N(6)/adenine(1519)-N(6))- dimethyltransferase RsmA n=1 Tax=Bullifex porci TaxID=2606638 RepID=UPI0023F0DEF0|nr:16S rRNA (adenine(1518)-N(6)/adenine(1519)-N(6))-dimethyltransferase RsmA [Bullifex porci]MDD7587876.1 16S rRNA (adenine(1518)-N(6)/adenine(1519)-N(6))-dimethyltransferase RsmA [Bullifex porci]
MWNLNYDSVKEVISVLESEGLAMSKKFGQNFLIDHNARESIREKIAYKENISAWEIGPGMGAITSLVLNSGIKVKAFEIDKGFCRLLKERAFSDEANFTLIEGDALKTISDQSEIPDIIYGNLPYNVGSIIIARLIENNILPERMVYTLQREVVERICAKENSDDYSSFSVLCQIDYKPTLSFVIRKGCFYPEPQVESAVVVMEKRKESLVPNDLRETFLEVNRALFSQRRKTIKNNLKALNLKDIDRVIASSNLAGNERAETLSIEKIVEIAEAVNSDKLSS